MTRRELLARCDSAELSEWLAFDNSFGIPDGYTVAGVVAPAIANAYGAKPALSAADFIPYFDAQRKASKRVRRMTGGEMRDAFRGRV